MLNAADVAATIAGGAADDDAAALDVQIGN